MLGVGGAAGAAAACFYVLAHALAKSALFMTSGAVTEATGAKHLSEVGGLARAMPVLAAGSGLAAAGLAALPLTIGFFKDELFFKAAAETRPVAGRRGRPQRRPHLRLRHPVLDRDLPRPASAAPARARAPAGWCSRWSCWARSWSPAGSWSGRSPPSPRPPPRSRPPAPVAVDPPTTWTCRAENVMALATYAAGLALVLAGRPALRRRSRPRSPRLGQRAGPERVYVAGLAGLNRLSNAIHDIEVRDLRGPGGGGARPGRGPGRHRRRRDPVRGRLPGRLVLPGRPAAGRRAGRLLRWPRWSSPGCDGTWRWRSACPAVGFSLAVAYELLGAPDVALVAVLIETLFMLLFVAVFALLPRRVLRREAALPATGSRRFRDPIVGVVSGVLVLLVVWAALSRPTPTDTTAGRQLALAEQAHGKDVVTVILADFRGLDTLVEITVLVVALLGVAALLRRGQAVVTTVLTRMVARLLLAPVLVVAAAVLVKGYADVGDGFAAGVIAALGVLLQYLAFGRAAVRAGPAGAPGRPAGDRRPPGGAGGGVRPRAGRRGAAPARPGARAGRSSTSAAWSCSPPSPSTSGCSRSSSGSRWPPST